MTVGIGLKQSFAQGLKVSFNTVSTIDIQPGGGSDSTLLHVINSPGTLTANFATSGANGLDTGLESSDQLYVMHLISDSSLVNSPASLISLSRTSPTLPSGYDIFKKVGYFYNNSSSDIGPFTTFGQSSGRVFQYETNNELQEVLTNGSAVIFTAVDCSQFVPNGQERIMTVRVRFSNTGVDASDRFRIRFGGSSIGTPINQGRIGALQATSYSLTESIVTNSSSIFDYRVQDSVDNSIIINVGGFNFSI